MPSPKKLTFPLEDRQRLDEFKENFQKTSEKPPQKKSLWENFQIFFTIGTTAFSGFTAYQLQSLAAQFNQSTTVAAEMAKSIDNLSSADELKGKLELIRLYALTEHSTVLNKCLVVNMAVASGRKAYKDTVYDMIKGDDRLLNQVKRNKQCQAFIEGAKAKVLDDVSRQTNKLKDSLPDQEANQMKDPPVNTIEAKILSKLTTLPPPNYTHGTVKGWIYAGQKKSDGQLGSDKTIDISDILSLPQVCEKKCRTVKITGKQVTLRDKKPQPEASNIILGKITGTLSEDTEVEILNVELVKASDGSQAYWIEISVPPAGDILQQDNNGS